MIARAGRLIRALVGPRSDQRGQALVEFTLIAPVLLILVLGIVDFARAWNAHQVITDAAREGARVLAVDNGASTDSVRAVVQQALAIARFDTAGATITIDPGAGRGTPAIVTISYPYQFSFVGRLVTLAAGTNQVELKTSFSMRNE